MTRLYLCALLLATLPACGSGGELPPQLNALLSDMQGCARLGAIDFAAVSKTVRDQVQNPTFPVQLDTDGDGTVDTTVDGTISGNRLDVSFSGALGGNATFFFQIGADKVTIGDDPVSGQPSLGRIADGDCSIEFELIGPFCVGLGSDYPLDGKLVYDLSLDGDRLRGTLEFTDSSRTVDAKDTQLNDLGAADFNFELPEADNVPPPVLFGDIFFRFIELDSPPGLGNNMGLTGEQSIESFQGPDVGGEMRRVVPRASYSGSFQDSPAPHPFERKVAYASTTEGGTGANGIAIFVVPYDVAFGNQDEQDDANALSVYSLTDPVLINDLVWSPDGNWIVFTDAFDFSIVAVRASDGQRHTLLAPPSGTAFWQPAFGRPNSSSAGRLYFVRTDDGGFTQEIVYVNVSSTSQNLTVDSAITLFKSGMTATSSRMNVDVSPNGEKLVFNGGFQFGDTDRIFVGDVSTGNVSQVTGGTGGAGELGDHNPVWWSDDTLVFARRVGANAEPASVLFAVDIDSSNQGSNEREIIPDGGRVFGGTSQPAVVPAGLR